MTFRWSFLAAALLALGPALARASEAQIVLPDAPGTALVTGKGYRFLLDAPKGWVLDNQGGASRGLTTVFYPSGQSFKDAPAILYANVAPRTAGERLGDFVDREIARARQRSPGLQVESHKDIQTKDGHAAVIRAVAGDVHGNREALAFVEEKEAFVILVLSARTKESFEASLPAFTALVRSYSTVGADVRIVR
jgi:hypothetical protein